MNDEQRSGRSEGSVRDRLRAGDPLAAPDAAQQEAAALARLTARLAALDRARPAPRPRWLVPLAATAAAVAAAWLGVRSLQTVPRESAGASAAQVDRGAAPAGAGFRTEEPEVRQVQFETPGGTRVVWLLDPRFDL